MIQELSDSQSADLAEARALWRSTLLNTKPVNKDIVEETLTAIYRDRARDVEIIWKDGPRSAWQDKDCRKHNNSTLTTLDTRLFPKLRASVSGDAWTQINEAFSLDVRSWLIENTPWSFSNFLASGYGGNLDVKGVAIYCFARDILKVPFAANDALMLGRFETLTKNAGMWFFRQDKCFVTERPIEIFLDDNNLPHSEMRAAIEWRDGGKIYSFFGMHVHKDAFEHPERLTYFHVLEEPNGEVRALMIDRMGGERFIKEGKGRMINQDKFGKLWIVPGDAEDFYIAEVINSSPEIGTTDDFKTYFLPVRPSRTVQEALAAGFGVSPKDYDPQIET